ncbi:component of cytosolic 80S ribosome and 60S large subunit [Haematococcus lacustris]|uniref:Component of cytosolic 80S ribosome and 60S large subunit n=1 Tax=Haematococcus lacustris TaxID=44745 RepID=A0A699ZVZ8_HAELA|nr:component of cytosolic 80S ribosome and 60S large subunit [Haematococcus lacustris]
MCRGGRMFAPTKVWRRWHRKININQKRYAVVSALAASALPSLVMARGHRVDQVPEVPLVLSEAAESITKTSKAIEVLKKIGAYADVEKAKDSKAIRAGKGKMRNRRYVLRKGPLVVYANNNGIAKAFRNLPGVEVASVDSLNLLQLAPGGHLGRFVIWTQPAFEQLDKIFGTTTKDSATKKGYKLPRGIMANGDLTRLINSDEIQSVVRAPQARYKKHAPLKKNPLKNLGVMLKLNPYAKVARRIAVTSSTKNAAKRAAKLAKLAQGEVVGPKKSADLKKVSKAFYKSLIVDSGYQGEDYDEFSNWLGKTDL